MKNVLLSLLVALFFTSNVSAETIETNESMYEVNEECLYANPNYCGDNSLTNGLEANQTTLFYMYSDENGHYFLDPLADYENVIYVDPNQHPLNTEVLQHGKRFVGTFTDNTLWELVDIEEVVYVEMEAE